MSTPGAVACLFALVFAVQHYRQILWPLLETADQLAPLRRAVALLMGTGGDRGRSIARGSHAELGGPSAQGSDHGVRPVAYGNQIRVSASAREPPRHVRAPAPAMAPSD